jgi:hypothetical protein
MWLNGSDGVGDRHAAERARLLRGSYVAGARGAGDEVAHGVEPSSGRGGGADPDAAHMARWPIGPDVGGLRGLHVGLRSANGVWHEVTLHL